MEGGYREQIVESEAQRLARLQEPYARTWATLAWRKRVVWYGAAIAFVGGAACLLGQSEWLVFGGWLVAAFGIGTVGLTVLVVRSTACPRCKHRFAPDRMRTGWDDSVCDNCRLPRGYLPTTEDLEAKGSPRP